MTEPLAIPLKTNIHLMNLTLARKLTVVPSSAKCTLSDALITNGQLSFLKKGLKGVSMHQLHSFAFLLTARLGLKVCR